MRSDTVRVLGFEIRSTLEGIDTDATSTVNTINPHSYVTSKYDRSFRAALDGSDVLLPDGVGITWAALVTRLRRIPRITGMDLFTHVLGIADARSQRCFFLGSSESVLDRMRLRLNREFPRIEAGFHSPPFRRRFSQEESDEMIARISRFDPQVLFVGMTAPKQEIWVHRHANRLPPMLKCCVGAVFDFYAGTARRSPPGWRAVGLEWLPRLIREPKRLWRRTLISTPRFLFDVVAAPFCRHR